MLPALSHLPYKVDLAISASSLSQMIQSVASLARRYFCDPSTLELEISRMQSMM